MLLGSGGLQHANVFLKLMMELCLCVSLPLDEVVIGRRLRDQMRKKKRKDPDERNERQDNDDENGNDNMEALLMEFEQIKNDRAKENLQKELWAPAPPSYENIWQLLSKFNDSDRKMIRGLKEGDPEDEMLSIIDNYKEQREQSERNLRLIHTPSLPSPDPNQSSQEGPCGMIPSPAPSPL